MSWAILGEVQIVSSMRASTLRASKRSRRSSAKGCSPALPSEPQSLPSGDSCQSACDIDLLRSWTQRPVFYFAVSRLRGCRRRENALVIWRISSGRGSRSGDVWVAERRGWTWSPKKGRVFMLAFLVLRHGHVVVLYMFSVFICSDKWKIGCSAWFLLPSSRNLSPRHVPVPALCSHSRAHAHTHLPVAAIVIVKAEQGSAASV